MQRLEQFGKYLSLLLIKNRIIEENSDCELKMKLTESNRNRVARRHSSRSRPYDLRRKVLVNNFLRDQTPYKSTSNVNDNENEPQTETEEGKTSFNNNNDELNETIHEEVDQEIPENNVNDDQSANISSASDEPESTSDTDTENTSLTETTSNYSPETKEFLHLISRRLKISENSKQNSPRLTRSVVKLRNQGTTSSSESDNTIGRRTRLKRICRKIQNRPQHASALRPLRSYPTFDRLNEIFESSETSQPFIARLVSKRFKNRRRRCANSKGKRNLLRNKISNRCRRMFKKLELVSENSSSSGSDPEPPVIVEKVEKAATTVSPTKQPTFTVRILDTSSGSSSPNYLNPNEARVTRSHSLTIPPVFTNLKTSPTRRKSESFKFNSGIFSISAMKSGSLL